MIFGNLKYADKYDFLTEKIKACFTYAKEHDLTTYVKNGVKEAYKDITGKKPVEDEKNEKELEGLVNDSQDAKI